MSKEGSKAHRLAALKKEVSDLEQRWIREYNIPTPPIQYANDRTRGFFVQCALLAMWKFLREKYDMDEVDTDILLFEQILIEYKVWFDSVGPEIEKAKKVELYKKLGLGPDGIIRL